MGSDYSTTNENALTDKRGPVRSHWFSQLTSDERVLLRKCLRVAAELEDWPRELYIVTSRDQGEYQAASQRWEGAESDVLVQEAAVAALGFVVNVRSSLAPDHSRASRLWQRIRFLRRPAALPGRWFALLSSPEQELVEACVGRVVDALESRQQAELIAHASCIVPSEYRRVLKDVALLEDDPSLQAIAETAVKVVRHVLHEESADLEALSRRISRLHRVSGRRQGDTNST